MLSTTAAVVSPSPTSPPKTALMSPSSSNNQPKPPANPLTDLIHTEKTYVETLKIIDSQIAAIWMKQMVSAAPDFSELLKHVHDVLKANKRFCAKLLRVAANPKAMRELGDILMQWIDDMEVPYASYSRSYIKNLDQRRDIMSNTSIQHLLQNLSANLSQQITLDTLFSAPVRRLAYYKQLYYRLLQSTRPGRADHKLLTNANVKLDTLIQMAQNSAPRPPRLGSSAASSTRGTGAGRPPEIFALFRSLNCTRVVDIFNDMPLQPFSLEDTLEEAQLVMQEDFVLALDNHSLRAQVTLTSRQLVIAHRAGDGQIYLMYQPISVSKVAVKAISLDRELVGEYLLQFSVDGSRQLVLKASSRETRNMWLGASAKAPNATTLTYRSLTVAVDQKMNDSQRTPALHPSTASDDDDIHSLYTDRASDEMEDSQTRASTETSESVRKGREAFRDTIMDFYDRRFSEDMDEMPQGGPLEALRALQAKSDDDALVDSDGQRLDDIAPRSVKMLSRVPDAHSGASVKLDDHPLPPLPPMPKEESKTSDKPGQKPEAKPQPAAPVQMTYIEPAVHKMTLHSTSVSSEKEESSKAPASESASEQQRPLVRTASNGTPLLPRSSSRSADVRPRPPLQQQQQQQQPQQPQQNNQNGSNSNQLGLVQAARSALASTASTLPAPRSQTQTMSNQPPVPSSPQQTPSQRPPQATPLPVRTSSTRQNGASNGSLPPRQASHPSNAMAARPTGPSSPRMQQQQQQQQQQQHQFSPQPAHSQPMYSSPTSPSMNNTRPPMAGSPQPARANVMQNVPARSASNPNYMNGNAPPRIGSQMSQMSQMSASSTGALDELGSPPQSPGAYANATKSIIYTHESCQVFHWKDQTWYSAESNCSVQVRITNANRACVSLQLLNSGQIYLTAWILPNTKIQHMQTDVNLSVYMGPTRENYLIHFNTTPDAHEFASVLERMHYEAVQTWEAIQAAQPGMQPSPPQQQRPPIMHEPVSLTDDAPKTIKEDGPQTLQPILTCKCKLFAQMEPSSWSNFGSVQLKISQQMPSEKMHIYIENGKTKLVSAVVQSYNVEKINNKRLSFLLINDQTRTSMVYMVNFKDEKTTTKVYDIIKVQNEKNGW